MQERAIGLGGRILLARRAGPDDPQCRKPYSSAASSPVGPGRVVPGFAFFAAAILEAVRACRPDQDQLSSVDGQG
jgi:hypothetical protein